MAGIALPKATKSVADVLKAVIYRGLHHAESIKYWLAFAPGGGHAGLLSTMPVFAGVNSAVKGQQLVSWVISPY